MGHAIFALDERRRREAEAKLADGSAHLLAFLTITTNYQQPAAIALFHYSRWTRACHASSTHGKPSAAAEPPPLADSAGLSSPPVPTHKSQEPSTPSWPLYTVILLQTTSSFDRLQIIIAG